jgi:hypothetical protein
VPLARLARPPPIDQPLPPRLSWWRPDRRLRLGGVPPKPTFHLNFVQVGKAISRHDPSLHNDMKTHSCAVVCGCLSRGWVFRTRPTAAVTPPSAGPHARIFRGTVVRLAADGVAPIRERWK